MKTIENSSSNPDNWQGRHVNLLEGNPFPLLNSSCNQNHGLLLDRFILDVSCSESGGCFYDGIATFQRWFQGQTMGPHHDGKTQDVRVSPKKQLVQPRYPRIGSTGFKDVKTPWVSNSTNFSMDWFKGKLTGIPHVEWENLSFPVDFPLNQSIEFHSTPETHWIRVDRRFNSRILADGDGSLRGGAVKLDFDVEAEPDAANAQLQLSKQDGGIVGTENKPWSPGKIDENWNEL